MTDQQKQSNEGQTQAKAAAAAQAAKDQAAAQAVAKDQAAADAAAKAEAEAVAKAAAAKRNAKPTLDRSRKHAQLHGPGVEGCFVQDGKVFNGKGEYVKKFDW